MIRDLISIAGRWPDETWPGGVHRTGPVVDNSEQGAERQVIDRSKDGDRMDDVISAVPGGRSDAAQVPFFACYASRCASCRQKVATTRPIAVDSSSRLRLCTSRGRKGCLCAPRNGFSCRGSKSRWTCVEPTRRSGRHALNGFPHDLPCRDPSGRLVVRCARNTKDIQVFHPSYTMRASQMTEPAFLIEPVPAAVRPSPARPAKEITL